MSVSRWQRRAIAFIAGIVFGIVAQLPLGMELSGHRSHRYEDFGGAMAGVMDGLVMFVAGATFGTLLTAWLLDGDEPLSRRRSIVLGVCGIVMVYLFFVANCG